MPGFGGSGLFPTTFSSEAVMLNDGLVSSGLIFINPTQVQGDITNMNFFLSANDGANWEAVSNGSVHAFTNTGSSLKYRLTGVNITLNIDATDTGSGTAIPIEINGNPSASVIAGDTGADPDDCP